MNTHDIELPPLPTINVMGKEQPQIWFTASEVDELRRAAIEPYQAEIARLKRIIDHARRAEGDGE